jgi:hypothetical protein
MVFADDPRLASAHWQAWIDAGAHEIVEVRRDRDGAERCTCEVVLARG